MKSAWLRPIKMSFLYRCVLCVTWCYFKLFYRYRVYGHEHYLEGGGIIAANHVSFYDPPIVSISWPDEVHFLARKTLFRGLFGKFIRALNAHPVSDDIGSLGTIRAITQLLKKGKKVVLFPEGSRSFTGELGEIKPGIAMLISRTGAAIIPAYIHGAYRAWPRGKKFPRLGGKIACIFGSPIRWSDFADMDKREAMQAVADRLAESIGELKKWHEDGARGSPP